MKLDFSTYQLLINEESPSSEVLRPVAGLTNDLFSIENVHYRVSTDVNDEYFWLYAEHGKSSPRNPILVDVEKNEEKINPRTMGQAEPNEQIFSMYSMKKQTLYFSSPQKRGFFEKYLCSKLNGRVTMKNFLKTPEEFADKAKTLESVKFTTKTDLASEATGILNFLSTPKDPLGYGAPVRCTLEVKFKNSRPTPPFVKWLKKTIDAAPSSLVCIGLDDNNHETIFNVDKFNQKYSIAVRVNDQGMYDSEFVKQEIISEINEV
ncbi:MAG: hypothetical protein MPK06_05440 [Alphaproteobacteria bacterium]|nr:hypothetical protein [Alphaproteobacteria bacterium]MDA8003742.1 hypothetical protein [Alphaproteobacteria bacterium]MDA8005965.1 hypothetical protein [Alphaproteobacteria bacterium]MDA8012860.1 hypothetical protein [Alphaproteobacteria bacterium]